MLVSSIATTVRKRTVRVLDHNPNNAKTHEISCVTISLPA